MDMEGGLPKAYLPIIDKLLGCSESNFVFSYENERRFSIRRVSNDHERSNSINLISHELLFAGLHQLMPLL